MASTGAALSSEAKAEGGGKQKQHIFRYLKPTPWFPKNELNDF